MANGSGMNKSGMNVAMIIVAENWHYSEFVNSGDLGLALLVQSNEKEMENILAQFSKTVSPEYSFSLANIHNETESFGTFNNKMCKAKQAILQIEREDERGEREQKK